MRKVWGILLLAVMILSVAFASSTQALRYDKCPDRAWRYVGDILGDEVTNNVCNNQNVKLWTGFNLRANWTKEDSNVPFNGEENPVVGGVVQWDKRVRINSVKLRAKMKASSGNIPVGFWVWDCDSDQYILFNTTSVNDDYWQTPEISVPLSHVSNCLNYGAYNVKVKPQIISTSNRGGNIDSRYLTVNLLNLTIDYGLEVVPGTLSVSADGGDLEVEKYEKNGNPGAFSVTADVTYSLM